jgi:glycosyltransferase involved in cell wall biosynthesis
MKATKDVAVLVPTINCDRQLEKMISHALLDETLDGESIFVVIDGGVTEAEIMNSLQAKGVKFKVRAERGGVAAALNSGLEIISSKYVRRMDADDEWINGSLNSDLLNLLGKHTMVFGYTLNKKNGRYFKSAIPDLPEGKLSKFAFLPGNPITHPAVCFDRNKIHELGDYAQFALAEDFELWMRLLLGGYTIYNSNLPTVVYSRDQNLASSKLLSKNVLGEVQEKWLELVGVEFELTEHFLGFAICRNIECEHTSSDVRKYREDLSKTLKKLRDLPLHPRVYMNIFIRSIITLIAHEPKLKTITYCFAETINKPSLLPNYFQMYLQDRWKLLKFNKSLANN